jgi:hypothetical protein
MCIYTSNNPPAQRTFLAPITMLRMRSINVPVFSIIPGFPLLGKLLLPCILNCIVFFAATLLPLFWVVAPVGARRTPKGYRIQMIPPFSPPDDVSAALHTEPMRAICSRELHHLMVSAHADSTRI